MNKEIYINNAEQEFKKLCVELKKTGIYKEIIKKSDEEQKAYRDFLIMASAFTAAAKEVEANSPLEAVKKVYSTNNVTRDYDNKGNIVVGRYTQKHYGRGYRTYVYSVE